MQGLPLIQNARIADKMGLFGHLRRYEKIRKKTYIIFVKEHIKGIYKHAGQIRNYNITKKEYVLDGATVMYGSASELRAMLEYDFSQEREFSYYRFKK